MRSKYNARSNCAQVFIPLALCMATSGCGQPQDYFYHLRFWEWYSQNAEKALSTGEQKKAEEFATSALNEVRNFAFNDWHLCVSLNRLADIERRAGKYKEATEHYRTALLGLEDSGKTAEQQKLKEFLPREIYRSYLGLAEIAALINHNSKAETLYKKALAAEEKLWNAAKLQSEGDQLLGRDIANTLSRLALVY